MPVWKVKHCKWQLFSVQGGRQSWGEDTFTLIFSTTGCLRTHGNTMEHTHSVLTLFAQSHFFTAKLHSHGKQLFSELRQRIEKMSEVRGNHKQGYTEKERCACFHKHYCKILFFGFFLIICLFFKEACWVCYCYYSNCNCKNPCAVTLLQSETDVLYLQMIWVKT